MKLLLAFLALVLIPISTLRAEIPLKDGDTWVMAGDSITAQHLHSNYFEAFCFARFPDRTFAFRNSGVGGHTIPSTLARFEYDIAAWKPTVVSVELGMNDQGGTPTDKFVANMGTMVGRIRAIQARPVIFSASPINNGDTTANLSRNKRLDEYATALKAFAAKENIPYADQFHALVDVWGKNYPRERLVNAMGTLKPLAADDSVAGVEHLRAFLAAQEKSGGPAPVSMHGDAVHPGATGQLMMAAALLKGLGADGIVSSVVIDGGKLVEAKGCKVDDLQSAGGKVSFNRTDERLPFPIPDDAREVLALDPTILELSQYTLKVTGLVDGKYLLKIDNTPTATVTAKELQAGVNLTSLGTGPQPKDPIAAQSRAILAAVSTKANIVGQWRSLSQKAHAAGAAPELKTQLAAMLKQVQEADQKIRDAAKPKTLKFDLSPQ
jgi:lysophospholipase L1-like esterase